MRRCILLLGGNTASFPGRRGNIPKGLAGDGGRQMLSSLIMVSESRALIVMCVGLSVFDSWQTASALLLRLGECYVTKSTVGGSLGRSFSAPELSPLCQELLLEEA